MKQVLRERRPHSGAVLELVALVCIVGCPSTEDHVTDDGAEPDSAPSYFRDVKPIVDAKCVPCHHEGAIAPYPLTTYEEVYFLREALRLAVTERTMPPWLAEDGCTDYVADRSLDDEQIDVLATWVDDGAPQGDPKDEGPPLDTGPSYELSRVDRTLAMGVEYTPPLVPDDYRCFVIDWPEPQPSYLTGLRFNPGNDRIVHHGIVFVAGPEQSNALVDLDARDDGPGYTCFGGPEVPAGWLGVWVPGTVGADFPADTGIRVEPGSKVVLQIHYAPLAGSGGDLTTIDVKLDESVAREAWIQPWMNPEWYEPAGMTLPAGDPDVRVSVSLDPTLFVGGGEPLVMHTVGLHMHLLGTAGKIVLERGDGTDDCLLDIERWDFHWQGAYGLAEPRTIYPGDRIYQECRWDNSAENQPSENGMVRQPVDTYWGEGTYDEMCLGAFYMSKL